MLRLLPRIKPGRQSIPVRTTRWPGKGISQPHQSYPKDLSKRYYSVESSSSPSESAGWSRAIIAASAASVVTGSVIYSIGQSNHESKNKKKPQYATLEEMKTASQTCWLINILLTTRYTGYSRNQPRAWRRLYQYWRWRLEDAWLFRMVFSQHWSSPCGRCIP